MHLRLWRQKLQPFAIRFIICFVIVGVAYAGVANLTHHKRPLTSTQKVAALRAALDQIYISGNQLANFYQSDTVTASALAQQFSQFQTVITSLSVTLKTAPSPQVGTTQRQQIQGLLDSQKTVIAAYKLAWAVIAKPLTYEPAGDLGSLDPKTDTAKLTARATAAQNGLLKAADNTATVASSSSSLVAQNTQVAPTLLDATTKQALQKSAVCFGQIASQLTNHQISQATATRADCISAYPVLRASLVQNLLSTSFNDNYRRTLKDSIPPLLKQLDKVKAG